MPGQTQFNLLKAEALAPITADLQQAVAASATAAQNSATAAAGSAGAAAGSATNSQNSATASANSATAAANSATAAQNAANGVNTLIRKVASKAALITLQATLSTTDVLDVFVTADESDADAPGRPNKYLTTKTFSEKYATLA